MSTGRTFLSLYQSQKIFGTVLRLFLASHSQPEKLRATKVAPLTEASAIVVVRRFETILSRIRFSRFISNGCLFTSREYSAPAFIIVYINDLLLLYRWHIIPSKTTSSNQPYGSIIVRLWKTEQIQSRRCWRQNSTMSIPGGLTWPITELDAAVEGSCWRKCYIGISLHMSWSSVNIPTVNPVLNENVIWNLERGVFLSTQKLPLLYWTN